MYNGEYTYLFPYEQIPCGAQIVIYGFGDVGQAYLKQLQITHYATIIGFLDRAYQEYAKFPMPVYEPLKIQELKFDYIVLAFKQKEHANDVEMQLLEWGIPKKKIIFQGPRNPHEIQFLPSMNEARGDTRNYAFQRKGLPIAIKLGLGLGDTIVKKRLIVELIRMAPEAVIDIYTSDRNGITQSIYKDIPQINQYIVDSGVWYSKTKNRYALAISVFYLIEIDYVNYALVDSINPVFGEKIKLHEQRHKEYGLSSFPLPQRWIQYGRALYNRWNFYTLYNYTGIFNITDTTVSIPMDEKYVSAYHALDLEPYITLSFGTGGLSRNYQQLASKQWPKEYFQKLIQLFKKKYPNIQVLQLGDASAERLVGCDKYIIGESIELAKYILKNSLLHIDTEGGLVHLATQLGTKCVVLFGSTLVQIYGYPQNINIVSQKCSGCAALYDDLYKCAKGLEKPECMYSITPEMVMEKVKKWL